MPDASLPHTNNTYQYKNLVVISDYLIDLISDNRISQKSDSYSVLNTMFLFIGLLALFLSIYQ
jgi:hypothetical protein